MSLKYTLRIGKIFVMIVGILLTMSPRGWAVGCTGPCKPSAEVFHSPFYGYYRTCWRPWPGGQPPCPCYPTPQTTKSAAPTPTPSEPAIEQLPPPRLEEPEDKGM